MINGRNGAAGQPGAWNGLGGITSTFAHSNGNGFNLAIGYGDNQDIALVRGTGSYTSFGGQTVSSNCVLIVMTRGADATLDQQVDAQDVTTLGSHFNKPNSGQWVFGDFDYSGTCDATDVTTLGSTFGKSTPTLSPATWSYSYIAPEIANITPASACITGHLDFVLNSSGTGQLNVNWSDFDVLAIYRYLTQQNSSSPIDWSTLTSTARYRLQYSTDASWSWHSTVIVAADVLSTTLSGLLGNTTYYVRLAAISPDGSYFSPEESAATLPDPPQDLTEWSLCLDNIGLSWDAVDGADGYVIYRSDDGGSTYTAVGTSMGTSFDDLGSFENGYAYHYMVTATVGGVESEPSSDFVAVPSP